MIIIGYKASREMEGRYMTLQELLKDERAEGRAEGRVSGIGESENIEQFIDGIKNK